MAVQLEAVGVEREGGGILLGELVRQVGLPQALGVREDRRRQEVQEPVPFAEPDRVVQAGGP